jgi:tRNA A37 N6-isopentenylltransferase MiaA
MSHQGRRNADEAMLMALACGSTVENAAVKVGVSPRTVHRRLKKHAFRVRLAKLKAEMNQRIASMLTATGLESVKTLHSLQEKTQPPAVRLGAARAVLELGIRYRESADLEERLVTLARQMKPGKCQSAPHSLIDVT